MKKILIAFLAILTSGFLSLATFANNKIAKADDTQMDIQDSNDENISEAIAALQILGYNKKEIDKVFENIDKSDLSVEDLIKKGLSLLAR